MCTHLFPDFFDLCKVDFLLPTQGIFEKQSTFLNNLGEKKTIDSLVAPQSTEQMDDWNIILLCLNYFLI